MSKIDLDQLRREIRGSDGKGMPRWSVLYKTLKEELSALNFWKNRPRGNPSKGGKKAWANKNKKQRV